MHTLCLIYCLYDIVLHLTLLLVELVSIVTCQNTLSVSFILDHSTCFSPSLKATPRITSSIQKDFYVNIVSTIRHHQPMIISL